MSLYLKYRPVDFENLVGQKFVKETLKKAIIDNKTIGAYLFCGPRGTGKTSSARIFAKTINCPNSKEGNPCLECDICKDFLEEKLIDIIEIDAASHTGVDNIREIIEKAQFQPTKTQYKIYIIDEVHMLSKGAFNALLKILEEPPKHVKFILATTETHKVPETIISRCQRYDFKRISDDDIKNRLSFIAKEEKVSIDEKSLQYIIKNSGGGLRNAISLFEQCIESGKIEYERIVEKMGIVQDDLLDQFLIKLAQKDSTVLDDMEQLNLDGKNIKLFFKELMFFTKNKALEELKSKQSIGEYIDILDILDDTYMKTKNSLDEFMTFTIGVLKIIDVGERREIIKNTPIKKEIKEDIPKSNKIEPVVEKKEDISHDDISNIFSNDTEEKKEEPIETSIIPSNFDTNTFVSKLKDLGAKGGLTMALRGADMSLEGNILYIISKTKIAKGQVSSPDNMNLMIQVMESMGIKDAEIKS